jgi:hypothetical protein
MELRLEPRRSETSKMSFDQTRTVVADKPNKNSDYFQQGHDLRKKSNSRLQIPG